MVNILQVIKKILTFILILTPAFIYFDIFKLDIDWFNLKERLKDLEKINQLQSLQLEDNKKLMKIQQNQQLANGFRYSKNIVVYFRYNLGLAIYLGYSYFNDGYSAAFNSIVEQSTANNVAVVENISKQSLAIKNSIT